VHLERLLGRCVDDPFPTLDQARYPPRMPISLRPATSADLPLIVAMLADDELGKLREDLSQPLNPGYLEAFDAIEADPHHRLLVAEDADQIVGTMQLTFLPGLSSRGAWRGLIEAVRIAADRRGQGLGALMITHAIAECRAKGCSMVQLTTNKQRIEAHRFYERLGFVATHEGYKLAL
jgi:GNAT superfamily N-acetyltransferase